MDTLILTLPNQVRIITPNSLELITTYVIREQEDWFEDEINFLRRYLQEGEAAIDIGANYGVYTLTMAKLVGDTGNVWAFEPTSSTAELLDLSIKENKFSNVCLVKNALSDKQGSARISLNLNSEMNSLVRNNCDYVHTEEVSLTTLDECQDLYNWKNIAYLKLDAEGEESNIISGGEKIFNKQSPLIQYEVRDGKKLHSNLIKDFENIGYTSYRLVPGLNVLVPIDNTILDDCYLLNLFCCKPDRAVALEEKGYLVNFAANDSIKNSQSNKSTNEWLIALTSHPYVNMIGKNLLLLGVVQRLFLLLNATFTHKVMSYLPVNVLMR